MKQIKKKIVMKRRLFVLMIGAMLLAACGGRGAKEAKQPGQAMREYVAEFLNRYPEATLQDIYKGSFQDYFGPAHIVSDREAAKRYILHELATADALGGERYEPCGWRGQYYRVNLSVIRDNLVDIDCLVDAFVESAQGGPTFTSEWIEEWDAIRQAVREVCPTLGGFAEDSAQIARLLSEGHYVVHHSRPFNEHYHPHYRIVRRDVFEQRILSGQD